MRGHLRERSPGHWAIVIDVRDPQTGKRKRRWHSFAGTKRQAQVECARLLTETKNGTSVDPTRITVATFLERWIEHMEGQVSPPLARALRRDRLQEHRALARRLRADEVTASPYLASLRQSAH
jgi:hypothetical protein